MGMWVPSMQPITPGNPKIYQIDWLLLRVSKPYDITLIIAYTDTCNSVEHFLEMSGGSVTWEHIQTCIVAFPVPLSHFWQPDRQLPWTHALHHQCLELRVFPRCVKLVMWGLRILFRYVIDGAEKWKDSNRYSSGNDKTSNQGSSTDGDFCGVFARRHQLAPRETDMPCLPLPSVYRLQPKSRENSGLAEANLPASRLVLPGQLTQSYAKLALWNQKTRVSLISGLTYSVFAKPAFWNGPLI